MNPGVVVFAIVVSYFFGTIPNAILIAKSKGVDITTFGSGNPGASNVGRALGAKYFVLVFVLDAAKGAIPVLIFINDRPVAYACGIAAVLGHMFPITRQFKGGKGVATGGGVILPMHPPVMIGALIVWLLIAKVTKKASIGSMVIAPIAVIAVILRQSELWEILSLVGLGVLIEIRHISNLKRLISGSEPPVSGNAH